jgi:hypothetical protein
MYIKKNGPYIHGPKPLTAIHMFKQGRSHIGDIGGTCLHYILEANYFSSVLLLFDIAHPREMI